MSEKSFSKQRTDEELMKAYQEGDSSAFNELYDRNAERVYGYLGRRLRSKELIDDVFQSTWAKFHHTRGQYKAPLPVMPWLFTICRTVMIDHLRQMEKKQENLQEDMESYVTTSTLVSDQTELSLPANFEGVPGIGTLSADQREALALRFEQDLSFEEIASRIRTTPVNARQLVSRALRKLKSFLEKSGGGK